MQHGVHHTNRNVSTLYNVNFGTGVNALLQEARKLGHAEFIERGMVLKKAIKYRKGTASRREKFEMFTLNLIIFF